MRGWGGARVTEQRPRQQRAGTQRQGTTCEWRVSEREGTGECVSKRRGRRVEEGERGKTGWGGCT